MKQSTTTAVFPLESAVQVRPSSFSCTLFQRWKQINLSSSRGSERLSQDPENGQLYGERPWAETTIRVKLIALLLFFSHFFIAWYCLVAVLRALSGYAFWNRAKNSPFWVS